MGSLVNRLLSLLVLVGYVVTAVHYGVVSALIRAALPLLLATACIWFPEELGDFTGVVHYHVITSRTPGLLVRITGWLVLILVPVTIVFLASGTRQT